MERTYVSEGIQIQGIHCFPQSLCQPKGLVPSCHGQGCLRLRRGRRCVQGCTVGKSQDVNPELSPGAQATWRLIKESPWQVWHRDDSQRPPGQQHGLGGEIGGAHGPLRRLVMNGPRLRGEMVRLDGVMACESWWCQGI